MFLNNILQRCEVPLWRHSRFIEPAHPRHLNLGEVQPHTIVAFEQLRARRGVREQLRKIRCIGSNKLAHDAKPTGWSVQAWDDR